MKLFDIPIRKIKWWERALLWFKPMQVVTNESPDGFRVSQFYKTMRGKIYILDSYTTSPEMRWTVTHKEEE